MERVQVEMVPDEKGRPRRWSLSESLSNTANKIFARARRFSLPSPRRFSLPSPKRLSMPSPMSMLSSAQSRRIAELELEVRELKALSTVSGEGSAHDGFGGVRRGRSLDSGLAELTAGRDSKTPSFKDDSFNGKPRASPERASVIGGARPVGRASAATPQRRKLGRECTRSGYLLSLDDVIGPDPENTTWRDEWKDLNLEVAKRRKADLAASEVEPGGKYHYETKLSNYSHQVQWKVEHGWSKEDAEAHVALSGICSHVLGDYIRKEDDRFAASAHALERALRHAAWLQDDDDVPPVCYAWITGKGGLQEIDPDFSIKKLTHPDKSGFKGLTCPGEISCIGDPSGGGFDMSEGFDMSLMFPGDGLPPRRREMAFGKATYVDIEDSYLVAFKSRQEDDIGMHSVIHTGAEGSHRLPPQTLVVFKDKKEAGEWVAPNGVRPSCGLIEVQVTFMVAKEGCARPSRDAADVGTSKFTVSFTKLSYGDRQVYARGRRELEGRLELSLAEEWGHGDRKPRRNDRWADKAGHNFNAADEYAYASGIAGEPPAGTESSFPMTTFAGQRDKQNKGKTLADFVRIANDYVTQRAAEQGLELDLKNDTLKPEEVLAIRLYTGPGYQMINTFLREMGKLSEEMRISFSHAPALTYATTADLICSAIRKLSRVNPATANGQDGGRRFRAVCGVLPEDFFNADSFGMIVATETGFLSSSMNSATPMHYMSKTSSNVLWELVTKSEDERGFHCGADVSMLSQFEGEKEELYPPLTMLRVLPAKIVGDDVPPPRPSRLKSATWSEDEIKPSEAPASAKFAFSKFTELLTMQRGAPMDLLERGKAPVTRRRRLSAYLERTKSKHDELCAQWQAELKYGEGKSFLHIVVEPSFV